MKHRRGSRAVPTVDALDPMQQKIVTALKDFFESHPYRLWVNEGELSSRKLHSANRSDVDAAKAVLLERKLIQTNGDKLAPFGRNIRWRVGERGLADRIEQAYLDAGFNAPPEYEVMENLHVLPDIWENMMVALFEQGRLLRIADNVTYHSTTLAAAHEIVTEHIRRNGAITVGELKDALNVTRKYAVAILEDLDEMGVTVRDGESRVMGS